MSAKFRSLVAKLPLDELVLVRTVASRELTSQRVGFVEAIIVRRLCFFDNGVQSLHMLSTLHEDEEHRPRPEPRFIHEAATRVLGLSETPSAKGNSSDRSAAKFGPQPFKRLP